MIDRILIPLDSTREAESALGYAAAFHRAFGVQVILLSVVEATRHSPRLFSESLGWRLAEAEGRSHLKQLARRLEAMRIPCTIDVVSGISYEEVLSAAGRWGVDLVILSDEWHGAGASGSSSGEATRKIINAASSSLLLIQNSQETEAADGALRTVVVPLDGSSRGNWALGPAASLARANDATLLLVHVVARPEFLAGHRAHRELEHLAERLVEVKRKAAERFLDQKRRLFTSRELDVRTAMAVARSIPRAIDRLAAREEGALLVLSAHGHSAGSGWSYGGVASALLAHGSSPTLVLQDLPRRRPSSSRRVPRKFRFHPGGIAGTRNG